jgi:hypothetical protein
MTLGAAIFGENCRKMVATMGKCWVHGWFIGFHGWVIGVSSCLFVCTCVYLKFIEVGYPYI